MANRGDPNASTGEAAAKPIRFGQKASTTNESENIIRYVDTVKMMLETKIEAAQSKMDSQVQAIMAEFRAAEVKRGGDFDQIQRDFRELPSTKTIWKIVGGTVGGAVAFMALLWTVFGAGGAMTGSFADKVLEQKEQQSKIEGKLDQLLKEKADDKPQASPSVGQSQPVPKRT